jgi:glycosyltransferase involved in cell wall biosynthesis
MKAVINYLRPQSGSLPSEIFGIDVAINNFLRAFFRYSRQTEFFFFPGSDESVPALKDMAAAENIDFARCAWIPPATPEWALKDVDLMFRPDPNIIDHIWRRLQMKGGSYATCSLVHTASGERIADVLGQYLLAPSQEGDAIICPSRAIRDSIMALWEIQNAYYEHRFKGHLKCPVELPIIPLGIHTDRFINITTEQHRKNQRETLGIADDEIVILYVGRLSYATKAHPLPLLKAADLAAQQSHGKKVRLVLYGFFKPEAMEPEFRNLAKDICKNIKVDFVLNNDPRFPDGLWAAGDIFASLIDNIQESFGFTPIEAMASGLPAVVSDWDGYRDGVRQGTDGFLIPTISVPAGNNVDVAAHYYNLRNYGDYLIRNNQGVAVDIGAAADALQFLIKNKERRLTMGAEGRKRAVEHYDWRVVIKLYEDLWEDLVVRRRNEASMHPAPAHWPAVHPSYPDPSSMFRGFPSHMLQGTDKLEIVGRAEDIELLARHPMNIFGMDMLLQEAVLSEIMGFLYRQPRATIDDIQKNLHIHDAARLMRSLAWFIKMGLMSISK